jgi:hypothetical protein
VRVWTVEEANAELPRITALVERVRAATREVQQRAEHVSGVAPGNGHAEPTDAPVRFDEAARELARDGIVLRDANQGLIDFAAQTADGRSYWLCWVVGEPAVAWWHWPEDGFAGRRPLDEPPR